MRVLSFLASLLPLRVRVSIAKKTALLIIDDTTFEECKSKVIGQWSWKRFKTEKTVVHFMQGKFITKRL